MADDTSYQQMEAHQTLSLETGTEMTETKTGETTIKKPAPINVEPNYNVDPKGWALIETYVWDVGEDEEIEQLIDKALRILLIHPDFDSFLWKDPHTIANLYTDTKFGDVVSQIDGILTKITHEMVQLKMEKSSAFSSLSKTVRGINITDIAKQIGGKSDLNDSEADFKEDPEEQRKLEEMSATEMFGGEDKAKRASKYAFWNITVYKDLKEKFGIKTKAQEAYLWSFLLPIACCIKYLEIEINAMPQFDIQRSKRKRDERQVIWKGFVVPPTHGTVGVNKLGDDEQQVQSADTHYVQQMINKQETALVHSGTTDHCAGCFVQMTEINYRKDGEAYCSQCVKFRVYQECVRKFVLEYDNEETRDDLWPWYENSKNQMDLLLYKEVLNMYTDQVLQIGSILESNLKYYVPRSQTLAAAALGNAEDGTPKSVRHLKIGDPDHDEMKNLLIKARTEFQPYRNIRYLRKFAAMFLLGERVIWKDLLKLKKYLKQPPKDDAKEEEPRNNDQNEDAPESGAKSQDKSAIDDDTDFKIATDHRIKLRDLLERTEIMELLYGPQGAARVHQIQLQILQEQKTRSEEEANTRRVEKQKAALSSAIHHDTNTKGPYHGSTGRFEPARSVTNINECRPGVEKFLEIWNRLPHWWKPIHDEILLELALMFRLDISKYATALDEELYYQETLEDFHYKAFEYWCTKEVNVQHRLRFLLFVIHANKYPDSMVFMNGIMKHSHLLSVKKTELEKTKSAESIKELSKHKSCLLEDGEDAYEQPVRDVEREFRDIVQLLEPEALGVRIWRFIMNQMAAKQRKSLWAALTILAEELPSNMVMSLLEEDRDLLRRGNPRYVNAVCQSVIKGSNYPTATALHLARYMEENATGDLARTETWQTFSDEYEDIAIHLINTVESDHLLAMLLEIPTDIQQKTIIEMAVLYHRIRFVNSARVQGVMTHMWSESEFLNYNKPVRTTYLALHEQFGLLWKSPVRYYYCPLGLYATTCVLYITYLALVSWISYKNAYPYTIYHLFSLETLMWICNAGYIIYEVLEFEQKRAQYFAMDSMINVLDCWIVINWILLFILRIGALGWAPDIEDWDGRFIPYVGDARNDTMIDTWAVKNGTDTELSLLVRTDPYKRNEQYTILYMAIWGIQMIILWIRIVGLLQRTEIMGPLLTMLVRVMKDVTSFLILVFAITCGFLFAVHYIVGGDIDRDVTCDVSHILDFQDDCVEVTQAINSVRGIALYLIQALLGQQDWNVMDTNPLYGFERGRAQLLTLVVLAYILMGGIISMNLLIAIMTTSFDTLNDTAQAQLAFLRVETTYDLAHRGRMMPPPFNVFVVGVWAALMLINLLIKALSCGRCKLNLDGINPYYIKCLRRGSKHGGQSIIKSDSKAVQSQKGYSASRERKDIGKRLKQFEKSRGSNRNVLEDAEDGGKKHRGSTGSIMGNLDVTQMMSLFESIDSMADDTKKRYCKHCYCRMKDIKDGRVENYFKEFEFGRDKQNNQQKTSFGLDKDDMRMIKRLFRYCSLCPQCFRPYGIWSEPDSKSGGGGASDESLGDLGTDRYDRHHVLMDVISCYFFLLLVWVPLMFILFIPAAFSRLFDKVSQSEQSGYTSNKQLDAGAFGDYHRGVEQRTVKSLVDKHYGGATVFDSDEEGDSDGGGDQEGGGAQNEEFERMLFDIGEKVNMIKDPDYKPKEHRTLKKKKQTIMQLEKKQREKKQREKKDRDLAELKKKPQVPLASDAEDEKEDIKLLGMFDTSGLRESITSAKNVNKGVVIDEDRNTHADVEEEEPQPQVQEQQEQEQEDDDNNNNDDDGGGDDDGDIEIP